MRARFLMGQKGFGEEEPGLQQKLEAFFDTYGGVNAVRMRRVDGKKEFKVRSIYYNVWSKVSFILCLIGFRICGVC